MTYSSNTTCTVKRTGLRLLIVAGALAAAVLSASPTIGQAKTEAAAGQLIIEAQKLLTRGDARGAEFQLRKALEGGVPRRAVAAQMGRSLLEQGRSREARRWLEKAEFSPATTISGLRALAALEMREGKLNKAGEAYNRALSLAPKDAALWVDIARFRYIGGEHLLAIEAADQALALNPEDPAALLLQAELIRDRRGMVPALPWFEKALERAPDDLTILLSYAATLGDAGESERMLAMTRRVLELDPGNPQAFYLQAIMAARAENYRLAQRLLGRIAGRLNDLPGYRLVRGVVEIGAGNYAIAVQVLDPLVAQQPGNSRARDLLARALYLGGEYRLVTNRFADAAGREGASAYLQMTVARAFEQLGERDHAASLLDRIGGTPKHPFRVVEGNNPIGELLAQGDFAQAAEITGEWIARNPGNFDHLAMSGDVAVARGDLEGALRFYSSAAQIRMPESLMTRRFQAMLFAGRGAQASQLAKMYLADNPASVEARRAVAMLAANREDWDGARRILENLVAGGRGQDVQLLANLAVAQIGANLPDDAEATARNAYGLYPANPVAAQVWGYALAVQGEDKRSATALLIKARAVLGDSPMLARARQALTGQRPL